MSNANNNNNNNNNNINTDILTHFRDTLVDAMSQLDSAKENLRAMDLHDFQELLMEKKELQDDVSSLRREKAKLLEEIQQLKKNEEEPTHEHQSRPTDIHTEPPQTQTQTHTQETLTREAFNGEETDKEEELIEVAIQDEPMYPADETDNEEEEEQQAGLDEPQEDFAFENIDMLQEEEVNQQQTQESVSTQDSSSSSTTTASASTATRSAAHNKKRRASKAFVMSPKKWRRMMRSHRLQSILIKA